MEDITGEGSFYIKRDSFESIALGPEQTKKYLSSDSMALNISIENFQMIEERLRKHVTYKITGEENSNKFEIFRRYKEFKFLHKVLSQTWPGCLIPKLPKKKAVVKAI